MKRKTLLAELNRLLDLGEPLLAVFPKQNSDDWRLRLPYNISEDMYWYATSVAFRAWDREDYRGYWQQKGTDRLGRLVNTCKAGLLGWRAIGVLNSGWSG